jgi:hypothetical protein
VLLKIFQTLLFLFFDLKKLIEIFNNKNQVLIVNICLLVHQTTAASRCKEQLWSYGTNHPASDRVEQEPRALLFLLQLKLMNH